MAIDIRSEPRVEVDARVAVQDSLDVADEDRPEPALEEAPPSRIAIPILRHAHEDDVSLWFG